MSKMGACGWRASAGHSSIDSQSNRCRDPVKTPSYMQPRAYFVAMCDVLGFSQLVGTTSLEMVHQQYRSLLDDVGPNIFRSSPQTSQRIYLVEHVVISDTILFWAPADGQIEILPGLLCILMRQLMGSMPLRVGIAFGDCVIDPQEHIYIGQPIIDAYLTEQAQEWVGGAYHRSCWSAPRFPEFATEWAQIVKYPVPVKISGAVKCYQLSLEYAVNWTLFTGPDVLTTIADQERRAPEAAKMKWRNARTFYEIVSAGGANPT